MDHTRIVELLLLKDLFITLYYTILSINNTLLLQKLNTILTYNCIVVVLLLGIYECTYCCCSSIFNEEKDTHRFVSYTSSTSLFSISFFFFYYIV